MEHCTTRFFETCDLDNDKYIALEEWAGCFGIKERECLGLGIGRSVPEGWDVVPPLRRLYLMFVCPVCLLYLFNLSLLSLALCPKGLFNRTSNVSPHSI